MLPPPRRTNARLGDPDAAIRATDSDAAEARVSAVRKQYISDPFIDSFVPRAHLVPARPPIINIGTYLRSAAIDELVAQWLACMRAGHDRVQIVSLGAGSDTRFWRLASGHLGGGQGNMRESLARYLELDFAENTARKVAAIRQSSELSSAIGDFRSTGTALTSDIYAIRDMDLRDFQNRVADLVGSDASDDEPQRRPLLDRSLPVLIIAECVFAYMTQSQSDAVIRWFAEEFPAVGAVVYEMFGLNDNFGRVMKENLKTRNVTLPGVDAYPTLESQVQRFTRNGLDEAHALSLRTIRNEYVAAGERKRISRVEWLDEVEELDLLLSHYVIGWGAKRSAGTARSVAERIALWALKRDGDARDGP